jgi:hypothetical protein
MAQGDKSTQAIILEELAVSSALQIAALVPVLERKGVLTHAEVLDEIGRQQEARARRR